MPNTYLVVPYPEKDRAKSLGARWDAAARQWYVPSGGDLTAFREWLPAGVEAPASSPGTDLIAPALAGALAEVKGVSLSQLMGGVAKAVVSAYREGVWTRAEVLNVSVKNGNVYLELSERDAEGRVLAKALGTIWSRTAERILAEFERATGAQMAPGIKVLVLAKPVVKPQYGLSVDISAIDASFTIGDLEAQKRKIREDLVAEQLFDRNRKLAPPWDFQRILVVSPESAAGLGDFVAEAQRLHDHGVCHFAYVHSRFQGQGAAAEILAALQGAFEPIQRELDAVVIIRGGGAVNDLAWLNDYHLARFVCTCDVPVLTGIGHERDSTILDEVAHRSFDTPSKVAAAIEAQVARRAREAREAYDTAIVRAGRLAERALVAVERLDSEVRMAARGTLASASQTTSSNMSQVQLAALAQVHEGRAVASDALRDVKDGARHELRRAKSEVPAVFGSVKELAASSVRSAKNEVHALLPSVLDQVGAQAELAQEKLARATSTALERAGQHVRTARQASESLAREIAGQGPEKTLARGFAVVKTAEGRTISDAQAARKAGAVTLTFKDGSAAATMRGADQQSGEHDER